MPDTPPQERRNFPQPEPFYPTDGCTIPDHWTWLKGTTSQGHQGIASGVLCRCGCEETRAK